MATVVVVNLHTLNVASMVLQHPPQSDVSEIMLLYLNEPAGFEIPTSVQQLQGKFFVGNKGKMQFKHYAIY